jgi:hypothetical protein
MRALAATVCALLAILLADAHNTAKAQAAWCAYYGPSTSNCGFYTFKQCQADVSGIGGWCERNYAYAARKKKRAYR